MYAIAQIFTFHTEYVYPVSNDLSAPQCLTLWVLDLQSVDNIPVLVNARLREFETPNSFSRVE